MKLLLTLLAILVIFQQQALPATKSLQGFAKIDERLLDKSLPPLDPTLAPGNTFDKDTATALLRKEIPQNVWYKIPTWLAGNWSVQEATRTWARDEITKRVDNNSRPEKNVTGGNFGYFPALDQNFWWQFADSECWGKTEGQTYTSWFFYQYIAPVNPNGDPSTKNVCIELQVDPLTNKILRVYQRQDIHTYTQITNDLVQGIDYCRQFDFYGKPIRSFHLTANQKRTSMAYVNPNTTSSGRNTTELILAYLQDRDMQDELNNIIRITQNPAGDHLAPLNQALAPGNTFNQDLFTTLISTTSSQNSWIKVPVWYAGRWKCEQTVAIYSRNEITGQEDNRTHIESGEHPEVTIGYFPTKDAWWQFADLNYWIRASATGQIGTRDTYKFIQSNSFKELGCNPENPETKCSSVKFFVDPSNNKVLKVLRQEYSDIAQRINDSAVQLNRSIKLYGFDGGVTSSFRGTISLNKLSEPVVRNTTESGQDATKLLFTFLINHKMIDEARTVISCMREKQMYLEADNAKKVLDALLLSPNQHISLNH